MELIHLMFFIHIIQFKNINQAFVLMNVIIITAKNGSERYLRRTLVLGLSSWGVRLGTLVLLGTLPVKARDGIKYPQIVTLTCKAPTPVAIFVVKKFVMVDKKYQLLPKRPKKKSHIESPLMQNNMKHSIKLK